jgi:hypothetical protein
MQVKTLYRYERKPNCVTISTLSPLDVEYTETYRLIADEGMILTNGVTETVSVDTDNPNEWQEIVDKYYIPEEELVNE